MDVECTEIRVHPSIGSSALYRMEGQTMGWRTEAREEGTVASTTSVRDLTKAYAQVRASKALLRVGIATEKIRMSSETCSEEQRAQTQSASSLESSYGTLYWPLFYALEARLEIFGPLSIDRRKEEWCISCSDSILF